MRKIHTTLLTLLFTTLPAATLWAQDVAPPAAGAPGAKPPVSPFIMQLPMILMILALLYFGVFGPQRKQAKQLQEFQKSIAKGDEIVTASGIIGKVAGLTDKVVTMEISPGTEIRMLRSQVQAKLKDLKTLEATP